MLVSAVQTLEVASENAQRLLALCNYRKLHLRMRSAYERCVNVASRQRSLPQRLQALCKHWEVGNDAAALASTVQTLQVGNDAAINIG